MSTMIPDVEDYFRRKAPERDVLLRELEKEAEEKDIPIIGPVVGELLYILTRISNAQRVLELGTASGYSGIYLGRAVQSTGGRLITVEHDPRMADEAEQNFIRAGIHHCVEIKRGDALSILGDLKRQVDLIFIDIEKEDYVKTLVHCQRLCRPGGLLIADNTAFSGAQTFNHAIGESKLWRAVQILAFLPHHSPVHDGLCIAMHV